MNPDIKTKWVDALRSGKYKQGKEALRRADDTFCCLGVLCDVLELPVRLDERKNLYVYGEYGDEDHSYLPRHTIDLDLRIQSYLAAMNDTGTTFEVIAAYIEANL